MSIKFVSPAIFVKDMEASRVFYQTVLGQEPLMALDQYMVFKGDFALWHVDSVSQSVFEGKGPALGDSGPGCEMYFESEELDAAWGRIKDAGAESIHGIREMPWGQRCFRLFDPDGYVVEVGEPMALVVRRFLDQGLSVAEVAERSLMPEPFIQAVLEGREVGNG